MRLPRVRLTVRGMLVAVAVAATLLAALAFRASALRRERLARYHRERERSYRDAARRAEADATDYEARADPGYRPLLDWPPIPLPPRGAAASMRLEYARLNRENARRWSEAAEDHARSAAAWVRAARSPWLVAPTEPN